MRPAKVKLLVIDDDASVRESFRMLLGELYEVILASGAVEAFPVVKSGEIDVIALDIWMPGMDGLELLRCLKRFAPDSEVFLVTGSPSLQSAMEAIGQGAYAYIVKPFTREQVVEVIEKGVTRRMQNKLEREALGELRLLRWA